MNKLSLAKINWRTTLGTLAISLGTLGIIELPAEANPHQVQDSLQIAQVGVRSRINAPTPLNLRPRTHIPLPSRRYNRRSNYCGYHGCRGEHRHHRRYRRSNRRVRYDHDHYDHHRRSRSRKRSVIIINPSNSNSRYSNDNGYIRVIRK